MNRIDAAVRDAKHDLELARMRKDRRREGEALERLREATTRQMRRDKKRKVGQFAPEAIEAARNLPRYDSASRRSMRKAFAAVRTAAQVGAFLFFMSGVGGLTLGAFLVINPA